ncbi:hypothetical protein [Corynebacterium flavescens]|uniref:hypothetical protein n=1 Tax=Corynebacterium flavescens TaxID=28028 RepID=UPI0020132B0D|nr:hypothetical protein [Corynebacterium flavescens]
MAAPIRAVRLSRLGDTRRHPSNARQCPQRFIITAAHNPSLDHIIGWGWATLAKRSTGCESIPGACFPHRA